MVDVDAIVALVNGYAAEDIMLPRTAAQVALALDDYLVATDERDRVIACGALREYSPALAELVSLAVTKGAHGHGLGSLIVAEVERLARKRGFTSVFAHTLSPRFFQSCGYEQVERSLYPEKRCREKTTCMRHVFDAARVELAEAA